MAAGDRWAPCSTVSSQDALSQSWWMPAFIWGHPSSQSVPLLALTTLRSLAGSGQSSSFPSMQRSATRLEQLRALENGFAIRMVETEYESLGVDTPGDLERIAQLFAMSERG